MTLPNPGAEEVARRRVSVRLGEWNDRTVSLRDGRVFHASLSELTEGGQIRFADGNNVAIAIVHPADVKAVNA